MFESAKQTIIQTGKCGFLYNGILYTVINKTFYIWVRSIILMITTGKFEMYLQEAYKYSNKNVIKKRKSREIPQIRSIADGFHLPCPLPGQQF